MISHSFSLIELFPEQELWVQEFWLWFGNTALAFASIPRLSSPVENTSCCPFIFFSVFLAVIAALYMTMSVCLSIGLSVDNEFQGV